MELTVSSAVVAAAAAIAVALASLVVAVVALRGQRRVRAAYRAAMGPSSRGRVDLLEAVELQVAEVRQLRAEVADTQAYGRDLRDLITQGLSKIGTVRYDAFDEMGGHLSFSTALLDERGDGLVVTAINGRTETRTYAKAIVGSESRQFLSDEETEAISRAMSNGRDTGDTIVERPAARVGGGRGRQRRVS